MPLFMACFMPKILPTVAPVPAPDVAFGHRPGIRRQSRFLAHLAGRANMRVADPEIEQNGAGHDGHVGHSGVVANAAFFEKIAHAARGFKAESAAARQHDRMNVRRDMPRVQRIELAGTGGGAADIDAAHGFRCRKESPCIR